MKGFKTAGRLSRRAICAVAACVSAMAVGSGAFAQEAEIPQLLEPVGVVTDTARAYIGKISNIDAYEAFIRPYVEGVAFQVSGIVEQVHVNVGQTVKKGDALITLDQKDQTDRVENLERQISNLRVDGDYTERILEIDRRMLELELEMLMVRTPDDSRAIAGKQLEIEAFDLQATLDRDLRSLELNRLQEELSGLRNQMVQSVITAPFDGSVMYMGKVETGMYVNAFTDLVFIADETKLRLESEYITDSVVKGANRVYALVGGGAYDLEHVPMDQSEMFAKSAAGETIYSIFEFADPDEQISAGRFAVLCIERNYKENVIVIPRNALYSEGADRYVYVMEDGVRVRRDVETGTIAEHLVEIESGLEEGDVVYVQE